MCFRKQSKGLALDGCCTAFHDRLPVRSLLTGFASCFKKRSHSAFSLTGFLLPNTMQKRAALRS
jgi:hypothetical protein